MQDLTLASPRKRGWFGLTPYINEEGEINLKKYKYSGGDTGFLYRYFWNPFANWLVGFLPMTLA